MIERFDKRPFLRPAVPPPATRSMIMFGGPCDGAVTQGVTPPPGYRDFDGALVVWHAVRIDAMPFWQGHTFKAAVKRWKRGE
jgi:hypothetical protein